MVLMSANEAAVILFSFVFIILNTACYLLSKEYLHICIMFSIFALSMLGSVVSGMDGALTGPIFNGLMLISGLGFTLSILFKILELIKFVTDKTKDHQL